MRIAIDARYLRSEYSGIGVYSEELLHALGRLDSPHEFVVIVHSSFRDDLELPGNFDIVSDSANPVSVRSLSTLGSLLNRVGADVLHSLFPLAPVAWRGKIVMTVHDLQPLVDPDFTALRPAPVRLAYDVFYQIAYPLCMRRANYVISDSFATRELIRQLDPMVAQKVLVVHPGMPENAAKEPPPELVERVREKYDIPGKFLFYLGSTRPNKNIARMLDAFETFIKNHPEHDDLIWVMVLRPDRFFDPIFAQIRDRGLLKRIHIHEQVNDAEKRVFYKLATLLYFVTKHEGFGLPILEAQALGKPVLAARHAALPEIGGKGALYCDPDSEDSIVAGLEQFFADPALADQLREAGYQNITRFSWAKAAREIMNVYEHLLAPVASEA